ncbi:Uncharacterized protein AXF42_Ash020412 [Apostasia shenzhenica]|uniref:ATPase inhibitor n=1 Tax=Apostasia shenzhenica TaxID=1088818 RepID=A0A2I0AA80_9ASPA|nr:Uncharacterized protein AXF42_Ash020412 [Apostasia shenzhenica]
MALRSVAARAPLLRSSAWKMEGVAGRASRYFSDGTGRVLAEEERAKENVYIQKMEREKLEKMRRKAEKERAEKEKTPVEKVILFISRSQKGRSQAEAEAAAFVFSRLSSMYHFLYYCKSISLQLFNLVNMNV